MRPPTIREVLVELGFNAEWQAAWDVLVERAGFPRTTLEECARAAEHIAMVVIRPDHGGLPWKGWVRPRAEPATETPRYPCIDVRRINGNVEVRVVDAPEKEAR